MQQITGLYILDALIWASPVLGFIFTILIIAHRVDKKQENINAERAKRKALRLKK